MYPDPLDTRVVLRVYVFQAQLADGRCLRDLLALLCPVEVSCVARKKDNAALRIRLNLASVELVASSPGWPRKVQMVARQPHSKRAFRAYSP